MKQLSFNDFLVTIFYHRNGTQLFIQDAAGC